MEFENFLRIEFFSRPENVGLARVAVAAFAAQLDYTISELDDLKGAVSEAVSNAIVHGYANDP
ncbi:MAG: ATP-binding protein, partial [Bacillota bacterium]|nr:ATP-binding protein [Bacillota bacterium]